MARLAAGSRPAFKGLGGGTSEGHGLSRRSRLRAARAGRLSGRVVPAATQSGPGGTRAARARARARSATRLGPRGAARARQEACGRRTHPPWPSSSSPACRPACPGTTRLSSSCGAAGRASAAARRTWGARGPRQPGAGAARVGSALVAAAARPGEWPGGRGPSAGPRPPPAPGPAEPAARGLRRLGLCGHRFQPAGHRPFPRCASHSLSE